MTRTHVAPWLVAGSVLLAGPAVAQSQQPSQSAQPPKAVQSQSGQAQIDYVTRTDPDTLRASDLIGRDVYGADNQDIGEVNDVLLNRSGQVEALVIGVGGFLGIGESNIAVPLQAVRFMGAPDGAAAGTPAAGTTETTGTGGTAGTTTTTPPRAGDTTADSRMGAANRRDGLPDRIVLNVTKQQLEAAPKFEARQSR